MGTSTYLSAGNRRRLPRACSYGAPGPCLSPVRCPRPPWGHADAHADAQTPQQWIYQFTGTCCWVPVPIWICSLPPLGTGTSCRWGQARRVAHALVMGTRHGGKHLSGHTRRSEPNGVARCLSLSDSRPPIRPWVHCALEPCLSPVRQSARSLPPFSVGTGTSAEPSAVNPTAVTQSRGKPLVPRSSCWSARAGIRTGGRPRPNTLFWMRP